MMPAYAVLIVLAFVFGPLVSVELGDWLFGDPLTGGPILLGLIVLAMLGGGWWSNRRSRGDARPRSDR